MYRVSKMVQHKGFVSDAYGFVSVVSPAGLPIRGIVGVRPDPIMFVAINCNDVDKSRSFYKQLGFIEQPYPYARPSNGTGPFEPEKPKKSVYMSPSKNCMGVLLLQTKEKATHNPVVQSLNLVYNPNSGTENDF